MASLTGSTIAASYEQLLSLPDGGLNGNTLVAVTDGDSSTAIGMKVATSKIEVIPASDDANAFEVSKADGTAVLTVNSSTVGATLIGALTVGVDDAGHDVIFYGNTASSNMTWDTSEDDLILNTSRLLVDMAAGGGVAVNIDSEDTSNNAFQIFGKYGMYVQQDISGGRAAYFTRDIAEAGSAPLVSMINDNANNTQPSLTIQQDGGAEALMIDMNANDKALHINTTATTSYGMVVQGDALTTGKLGYFYSASTTNDGRNLVDIVNANSGADGTKCLNIQQEAGNIALRIDQNANSNALYIDSESTSAGVIYVDANATTTGFALEVVANAITAGSVASFTTSSVNLNSTAAGGFVEIISSGDTDTNINNLLFIKNDHVDSTATECLHIIQDSQDYAQRIACTNTTESNGLSINAGNDGNDFPIAVSDRAGTTTYMTLNGSGHLNLPKQPAFLAFPAATQTNFAENTVVSIKWGTQPFDQGDHFTAATGDGQGGDGSNVRGRFVAPITGNYQLNVHLYMEVVEIEYSYYELQLVTHNKTYYNIFSPGSFDANAAYWTMAFSVLADMDASDEAYVNIQAAGTGGGANHDISVHSMFSGFLAC